MAARASTPTTRAVEVPPIRIMQVRIHIVGSSPLIVHAFSQKALQIILGGQQGKVKGARDVKEPATDFMNSLHVLRPIPAEGWDGKAVLHDEDPTLVYATGRFGFPSSGFKQACVRASKSLNLRMTDMRAAFFVPGEMVEILPTNAIKAPTMRMDMARVANGNPDVRFRAEFSEWEAFVPVDFDCDVASTDLIAALFRKAGVTVGIGDWRAEKDGPYGAFDVRGIEEMGLRQF